MVNLNFNKKGVPVTLIGLNNAGKTSLALRLATGKWVDNTSPTIGVNFEMYRAGDSFLKIFDVGGHEVLRRQFWLNYAANSYGVLFLFDASDKKRTEEGREWFWYLINNLKVERRLALAFLANKADLESMGIDEIIKALDLHKLSNFPKISFQIFEVSVKTAMNIDNAMGWFTKKIHECTRGSTVSPKGLIISSVFGNIKLFLDFSDVQQNLVSVLDMLSEVLNDKNNFLRDEKIASVVSKYGQIVFQERGEIVISLIMEPSDSQVEALRLIELIYEHIEAKHSASKDELIEFIIETLNIPINDYGVIEEFVIKG